MTEDQLEAEAISWLVDVGYTHRHGATIATDRATPERSDYRQVVLRRRLQAAIDKLNPDIPAAAREDALQRVLDLGIFDAVGLEKPNIGLLDDAFLAQVRNLPERNVAVELLERLLEGEIKAKFASNVV